MITLNAFLFWAILSVVFMAGFLTCSLLCINDLKPRLTQTPEEAAKDERHSRVREEQPSAEEIKAARYAATNSTLGCNAPPNLCKSQGICPGFCYGTSRNECILSARLWLTAHGLPIKEPDK